MIDGGLKSREIMREARKAGVKVVTRLNSNSVVLRFGRRFKKEDIIGVVKPIERTIGGEKYIIYEFKRCIWQGTAGNLFLVKGEGYDDFIPLFTTSLKSKAETVIGKYKGRTQIEQTNKELKSYLGAEGNYKKKKESNYGYIFIVSLVYNLVQYLRSFLKGKSFKDVLEELSFYLLWKDPPECVFSLDRILNPIFKNIVPKISNKVDWVAEGPIDVLGEAVS